ncbi:MAG: hypothetical protein P1U58_16935, partial [Verrucomicrobiales bacterium]|nr:hypothetical protein [Verrucomicrobiales bacterium]
MNDPILKQAAKRPKGLKRIVDSFQGVPMSRREALRKSVYGSAGLLLMEPMGIKAASPLPRPTLNPEAPAKSVIQIWLWGGPCHIDTFDP